MRTFILLFLLLLLAVGCQQDPDAYYTCFGGVKVQDLAECDFSTLNITLEDCDKVQMYDSGAIITTPGEVITVFNAYAKHTGENLTFVSSEYYTMIDGMDYYRFSFFNHQNKGKYQFFVSHYGVIYQPQNCK